MRFLIPTILLCAFCLAGATNCAHKRAITNACDVLVPINPLPASNAYLVLNDRSAALGIARHRGRVEKYGCGASVNGGGK